jgi:sugar phosphate isomerase/epimerase
LWKIELKILFPTIIPFMSDLRYRLALSTCWCSHRHTDGYAMLAEMRELGFRRVELSHGIRLALVPGILKGVAEGLVTVSSVHNFCPLPGSVTHPAPNLFQPSTKRKSELAMWHLYSRQTIEFAKRVGAPQVVMHSGSVRFPFASPVAVLESLAPPAAQREKALARLRAKGRPGAPAMRRLIRAYDDLIPYAASHGVRLGAENREGILELPLDENFPAFLDALDDTSSEGFLLGDKRLHYWHDTGHARIKHLHGLLDHERHLAGVVDRLIGFHLHDVSEAGSDHQVPGSGSVDFAMVKKYIEPHHTLVLEPSPALTPEEITRSRNYLLEVLG